jgi:hypothetical protein
MYYSNNHVPSKEDLDRHYKSEIARLRREKHQAKIFIQNADKEITKLNKLISYN